MVPEAVPRVDENGNPVLDEEGNQIFDQPAVAVTEEENDVVGENDDCDDCYDEPYAANNWLRDIGCWFYIFFCSLHQGCSMFSCVIDIVSI